MKSDDSDDNLNTNSQSKVPKTYFQLIQKVGSSGKYQRNMFYIFIMVYFSCGTILLANSFMFLNNQYHCKQQGLLGQNCKRMICQIPDQQQRLQYFRKNKQNVQSIATDFGPFICEDQYVLDIIRSSPYFGSLLAFIIFSYISDNFGRRTTMLASLSFAALGCAFISIGYNLTMIIIGAILAGGGINASTSGSLYFLGQTVQNTKRQQYSTLAQAAYTIGAVFITAFYYFLHNWKIVSILLQTIPTFVTLLLVAFYIEQSPLFLLKQSNKKVLKALNRIGQINYGVKNILNQEDIQNVRKYESQKSKGYDRQKVSLIDIIRFRSLRVTTILASIVFFVTLAMYYGPALIIDSIGFNTYVSNFAIQVSELIGYIPCYLYIDKVGRKTAGFWFFLTSIITSFILTFVKKPQGCTMCYESYIELTMIFIFRFAIATQFTVFNVYSIQLFPTRVIGICCGVVNIGGTLASTLSPVILGGLQRLDVDLMLYFLILGIIGFFGTILLQQTLGKPLKRDIQQLQLDKGSLKLQNQSLEQSAYNVQNMQPKQFISSHIILSKNYIV